MKAKSLLCAPLFGSSDRFNRNAVRGRYTRHVDTGVSEQSLAQPEEKAEDVRLTFLPERSYEPLVEEGNQQNIKEEKKAKKKEKYKKYRKVREMFGICNICNKKKTFFLQKLLLL